MSQGFRDKTGVGDWSIHQPKWHSGKLKLPKRGREGGLLAIGMMNRNNVKGSSAIESGEHVATVESRERLSTILGNGKASCLVIAFNCL